MDGKPAGPGTESRQPLRELFPTQNGRRMWSCPNCGNHMAYWPDHGGYRCLNIGAGCTRTVYPA